MLKLHPQEFVMKRAKAQHYEDAFVAYIVIHNKTDEAIIISETYVYWRKESSLWGRTWTNISHILYLGDSVGVYLYASSTSDGEMSHLVKIPCRSKEKALAVYDTLAKNAFRMGNPVNVIPTIIVSTERWLKDGEYQMQVRADRSL